MQHVIPCEDERYYRLKIDEISNKCFDVYSDFPILFVVKDVPEIFDVFIKTSQDLKISWSENPKKLNYSNFLASEKKLVI